MREKKRFEVENMTLDTQELDEFVKGEEINRNRLTMAFVAGGQGGGNIASEFCRLGYPLVAYNTCGEDLDDLEAKISKMETHGEFTRIDLNGCGGASKDRDLGQQAIKDSGPQLKEKLLLNKSLREADFVWVVVSLGGGTGNGSLSLVCKMLADYVRKGKERYSSGKLNPTIGVIAAIPDQAVKSKIRLNVAKAIQELEMFQAAGLIGSVLLLDNQKLIDDFRRNYRPGKDVNKTWVTDGNNKVARIITELALSTSLKSSYMLDVAEMLNIWSTPGFMTIGKSELGEVWMVDKCIEDQHDDIPFGPEYLQKRRQLMAKMIKDSFSESVFVEGTDLPTAINGGMVIITDGTSITSMDAKDLEDALSLDVLNSEAIETPHFGFVTTENTGVINKQDKDDKGKLAGRIFTMCVSKGAPGYIKEWFKDAIESKGKYEKAIKDVTEDAGLQVFAEQLKSTPLVLGTEQPKTLSLDDIFGGGNGLSNINTSRESNLDDLDKFFNSPGIFGSNNLSNQEKTQDQLLAELYEME